VSPTHTATMLHRQALLVRESSLTRILLPAYLLNWLSCGIPRTGTFIYSVFYTLLSLPALVITYRAIITPYRLPAFKPMLALRVLLTPTERRRPWVIYFTPGLLVAQVLQITYVVLVLHTLLRVAGMGDFYKPARGQKPESISWWQGALWLIVSFASTIILTPLEVITTRCERPVGTLSLLLREISLTFVNAQTRDPAQSRLRGVQFCIARSRW
jgi:hypothetical protein